MIFLQRPKKSLGQNFLIDQNIIDKIVKIGNIKEDNIILDIGAGYGNLTKKIAYMNPKKIFAIEKDRKLAHLLKKKFQNYKNIIIINDDIFNFFKKKHFNQKLTVFGNLPYNISTQILSSLILLKKWPPWYNCLLLMFQKEVAERILAKENTKEFGRLAVLCNWRLEVKKHFDISKNSFLPKPKINSTLLSFKPIENNKYNLKNPKTLEMVTRILFSNKRKMINKNFLKLFNNDRFVAKSLNLDLSRRPGELSKDTFYKISTKYEELLN